MQQLKQGYEVHKFGGSSLASAERFRALESLLPTKNEIIVVSAVQGTTNALQNIIDAAKNGDAYLDLLAHVEKTHQEISQQLSLNKNYADITEIKDLLHSVQLTGSCSKEIQDFILGQGEIWSAHILTDFLAKNNQVIYLDASTVLFTSEKNGLINIDWPKSQIALDAFLKDKKFDQIIITGFIASTLEGRRTTLGRNGSDFSAAIFAKLFNAKHLTIWTDVDGIYSADPNRVHAAFVIDSLSYKEALELAYFGAKVLHPMTIAPALEGKIPITIKNSLNPTARGTYISDTPKKSQHLIKGLTCIDAISLINIEGTGMTGVSGIAARVFQILHHNGISVILISQASSEHSICFAVTNTDTEAAVSALKENLQFEIERKTIEGIYVDNQCAILSAVGDNMVGAIGISGKLCESLAKANINIRAISQGSSERNISVVVKHPDINRALQSVHAGFYLSRKTISIGLIGPGSIGSTLLQQIHAELEHLKLTYHVNLYIRGIMNSKKMLLSENAIDLSTWESQLNNKGKDAELNQFMTHISTHDLPHAVIIDCTANPTIAQHYIDFMDRGIHVITPNKHANAGDLNYYKKLKLLTQKKEIHYLYEATVCAGLPVINTLQDLLKTGDHVNKIEGVVSGTLSYLFSELAKDKKFSDIIKEAKKLGYTEPDPREDLSGMDVARKLVCLAREMGHAVSISDVNLHSLVDITDDEIHEMVSQAKIKNQTLAYVGEISADGKITVNIKSLPQHHPLSRLAGTDNMLIFHTHRYHTYPLVIQGPGAGAEVTAAGIFADLLRLVSYLS